MSAHVPASEPSVLDTNVLHHQLMARHDRLSRIAANAPPAEVAEVLRELDAALERIEAGSFGSCEACHAAIEHDLLAADPLVRVCLDCMSSDQRRFLEYDLELAASIQTALLPARYMADAGWEFHLEYRPLGVVSGDYCDLIRRDRDLLFILGDVSGKGVAAAMLMANLQAAFRSLAGLDLSLPEMLARANRLFCAATPSSSYATLVCGRLSREGTLEIGNAGHTPPLLSLGQEVVDIAATGVPLGLFKSARFDVATYHLTAGDRLLLYTDGVSETLNGRGEEYGIAPLRTILLSSHGLSASEHVRAALEDLGHFRGSSATTDDVTLAALHRTAS